VHCEGAGSVFPNPQLTRNYFVTAVAFKGHGVAPAWGEAVLSD
jgi:hypothetical protein